MVLKDFQTSVLGPPGITAKIMGVRIGQPRLKTSL